MENYSRQREEIIKIIKGLTNYPTAEEIYFLAKQEDPAVSRSTIYRNLKFWVEKGDITQIAISNGADRYEYIKDKPQHGYVVCIKCGKLYDFDYNVYNIKNDIFSKTGIEIVNNGIVAKGICNSCKEN